MIMKLGMEHYVLKLYKVYMNDDPELTLTHFKTMSNLVKLVFVFVRRPRYQVSVYRTIGPLVMFGSLNFKNLANSLDSLWLYIGSKGSNDSHAHANMGVP